MVLVMESMCVWGVGEGGGGGRAQHTLKLRDGVEDYAPDIQIQPHAHSIRSHQDLHTMAILLESPFLPAPYHIPKHSVGVAHPW